MQTWFFFFFFLMNSVWNGYLTVGIRLRRRRRNRPVLNMPFCLYLVVDEHGHLKIYLPKKLLECLPKCTSLPKERHRWNTNEVRLYHPGSCTFCLCPWESVPFFRPFFDCVPVCHEPLCLLRVTRSFLLVGPHGRDFVHLHLDCVHVSAANAALA